MTIKVEFHRQNSQWRKKTLSSVSFDLFSAARPAPSTDSFIRGASAVTHMD